MAWNYRVLRHPVGHLALHEVYYDKAGNPDASNLFELLGYLQNKEGIHFVVPTQR
ncbi:MAG: hypothetical protein ABSA52_10410 [Candidatus Binatia bacterium]|jgi:hypothetical protein